MLLVMVVTCCSSAVATGLALSTRLSVTGVSGFTAAGLVLGESSGGLRSLHILSTVQKPVFRTELVSEKTRLQTDLNAQVVAHRKDLALIHPTQGRGRSGWRSVGHEHRYRCSRRVWR